MSFTNKQTSLITILSSEHGRLRREQRDIDKRDLQKALKYGTKDRACFNRWKVEYDGIVFIVDDAFREEVTAYPSPLAFAPVDSHSTESHEKAKLVLKLKPELCSSHTVLVVDNSGSMRTHDIVLHKDRHTAVYTVTAMEFVAEQLFNSTRNNSDVVSLIEFSNTAQVVFTREPVSWILYNKLLSRRDTRSFKTREYSKMMDLTLRDSNYLPALEEAEKILGEGDHETCAMSLFFLSDGAPTDSLQMALTPVSVHKKMCEKVKLISSRFQEQLSVTMVGFGDTYSDFSTLESMVREAERVLGPSRATFMDCEKLANNIGTAITSLVSSTTQTRITLIEKERSGGRTKRNISSEAETQKFDDWNYFHIVGHYVYDSKSKGFIHFSGLPPGASREDNTEEAKRRQMKPPLFLAINKHHCGKGAERVAFRCRLADGTNSKAFTLGEMVAKETNLVERIEENVQFHENFLEGQDLAAYLADEFNRRLRALPDYNSHRTPRVSFLPGSVLVLKDDKWPGGKRGVLVEKMLDTLRHGWCKWNDNAGGIDGRAAHVPIDVNYELKVLKKEREAADLGAIVEESDDNNKLND